MCLCVWVRARACVFALRMRVCVHSLRYLYAVSASVCATACVYVCTSACARYERVYVSHCLKAHTHVIILLYQRDIKTYVLSRRKYLQDIYFACLLTLTGHSWYSLQIQKKKMTAKFKTTQNYVKLVLIIMCTN